MKSPTSLLILFLFSISLSYSQIPEDFLGTWYLESFSMPSQGEIFVNTLNVNQGPSFTVTKDLVITGNSFCNDFSGNFEYVNPEPLAGNHTFRPRNIDRGTEDCGNNEAFETQFFLPFMEESMGEIFVQTEDFLVIQYFQPSVFYQTYRNEPVLSIEDKNSNDFILFPNPASEFLNIIANTGAIETIKLYNNLGVLLRTYGKVTNQMDLSELKSGMYFLQITAQGQTTVKKFLKQ